MVIMIILKNKTWEKIRQEKLFFRKKIPERNKKMPVRYNSVYFRSRQEEKSFKSLKVLLTHYLLVILIFGLAKP